MSNVTIRRPKCSVRGCPDPIRTRKLGLCNMHRARFLRTGNVGPAGHVLGSSKRPERSSRQQKMARELASIVRAHGAAFRIWWSNSGTYEVRDQANKHAAKAYAIPLILSLERRGWIKIDNRDQLVKAGRVTAKGDKAIAELKATAR